MNSRKEILKSLKRNKNKDITIQEDFVFGSNKTKAELIDEFKERLSSVGALNTELNGEKEAAEFIRENFDSALNFDDPAVWHEYSADCPVSKLEKIKVAVLKGRLGVAENGAVWIDERNFPHRLIPFAAQQVVIILNQDDIVSDMHEAYREINLEDTGYGVFISGPSKTADIEQSLVYGAHGPNQLHLILV